MSFDPNPGNPTELTLSEKRRLDSSNGQIVFEAELHACSPFSGGVYSPAGDHAIGIGTKNWNCAGMRRTREPFTCGSYRAPHSLYRLHGFALARRRRSLAAWIGAPRSHCS